MVSYDNLKTQGNLFFQEFKSLPECLPDRRRESLHKAIACYDLAEKEADKTTTTTTTTTNLNELKRATSKNRALMYLYLSTEVETLRPTRKVCFLNSAEAFSQSFSFAAASAHTSSSDWIDQTMVHVRRLHQSFHNFTEDLPPREQMSLRETFLLKMDGGMRRGSILDQKFRTHLAEMWVDLGRICLDEVAARISDGDPRSALSAVKEAYRPIEEAKRHAEPDTELAMDAAILERESQSCGCIVDALLAHGEGRKVLEEAIKEKDEKEDSEKGWRALDKFREANCLSRGEDVQVLCRGLLAIGLTYLRVFKSRYKAKNYFKEAMDLAGTLQGTSVNLSWPWYKELVDLTQEIRDEEIKEEEAQWENARKPFLVELKAELEEINSFRGKGLDEFFALLKRDKYRAKHREEEMKGMPEVSDDTVTHKRFLVKAIALYHPDKVDRERFGMRYKVMCEEISKALTERYNKIKEAD